MDITDSCLDAETLAAWVDGGLSAAEVARVQTHAADCARCQAMIGTLNRIDATVPSAEPEPAKRRWLPWLVPLTAAAVAVAIWVAVPRNGLVSRVPQERAEPAATTQAQGSPVVPAVPVGPAAPVVVEGREAKSDPQQQYVQAEQLKELQKSENASPTAVDKLNEEPADSRARMSSQRREDVAPAAPAARPLSDAAGSLAAASPRSLNETVSVAPDIVSPDRMVRWRIIGNAVQRSTNGGADWQAAPTGVSSDLLAGAAPSAGVCWIVGRAGVVLLSTDGRTWRRVPFPEITDLSAIRARDERSASVTTADGRILSTTDAGATWSPGPLQGF